MAKDLVIAAAILLAIHLAGGAVRHARHYRRHGMHPDLYYTYGRGWYGSIALPGGFRLGHRITAEAVLTLLVIVAVGVLVVAARLGHRV